MRPDLELQPSASQDATPLVFGEAFAITQIAPGGDPNLPPVVGLDDEAVLADPIRGDDPVEARQFLPIEG